MSMIDVEFNRLLLAKIYWLREYYGSLQQISIQLHVNKTLVWKWYHGQTTPNQRNLAKLDALVRMTKVRIDTELPYFKVRRADAPTVENFDRTLEIKKLDKTLKLVDPPVKYQYHPTAYKKKHEDNLLEARDNTPSDPSVD